MLLQQELKEVEEKFRKAMIQTAQLDNEKSSLTYQVELLKDRLEDLEETHSQLQVRSVSLLSFLHYAIVWQKVPINFISFCEAFSWFFLLHLMSVFSRFICKCVKLQMSRNDSNRQYYIRIEDTHKANEFI